MSGELIFLGLGGTLVFHYLTAGRRRDRRSDGRPREADSAAFKMWPDLTPPILAGESEISLRYAGQLNTDGDNDMFKEPLMNELEYQDAQIHVDENSDDLLDYNRVHPIARNPSISVSFLGEESRTQPHIDMIGEHGTTDGKSELILDGADYRVSAPQEESE